MKINGQQNQVAYVSKCLFAVGPISSRMHENMLRYYTDT